MADREDRTDASAETEAPGGGSTPEALAAATRAILIETEIAAPAEAVWRALTEAEQLASWFATDVQVEPGVGGRIMVSWGGSSAYGSRIQVWEPGRHLRLIDQDADPAAGIPVPVAQDYHIEAKGGGTTVLRFVHSGFSKDAQWDEMFDTMSSGWRYFFFNLKFLLERHGGRRREMIWTRREVHGPPRADVWPSLLDALGAPRQGGGGDAFELAVDGERQAGTIVHWKPDVHFAGTLPGLNDALLFIELESGAARWHAGFWFSTWGLEPERLVQLQRWLDALADRLLPSG